MAVDPDVLPEIDARVKAAIDLARVEWQKDIADAIGVPPVDPPPVDPPPSLPARVAGVPIVSGVPGLIVKDQVIRQPYVNERRCLDLAGAGSKVSNCTLDGVNGGQAIYGSDFTIEDSDLINFGGGSFIDGEGFHAHGLYQRVGAARRCRLRSVDGQTGKNTADFHVYGSAAAYAEFDWEDIVSDSPLRAILGGTTSFKIRRATITRLDKRAGSFELGTRAASEHGTVEIRDCVLPHVQILSGWQSLVFVNTTCASLNNQGRGSVDVRGLTVG